MQIKSSTKFRNDREKMLLHREKVLEAEFSRLHGEPTYSIEDVRNRLKEKYRSAKV